MSSKNKRSIRVVATLIEKDNIIVISILPGVSVLIQKNKMAQSKEALNILRRTGPFNKRPMGQKIWIGSMFDSESRKR